MGTKYYVKIKHYMPETPREKPEKDLKTRQERYKALLKNENPENLQELWFDLDIIDCPEDTELTIEREDIAAILQQHIESELTDLQVEDWADYLIVADQEAGGLEDDTIFRVIFRSANQTLEQDFLTPEKAEEMLGILSAENASRKSHGHATPFEKKHVDTAGRALNHDKIAPDEELTHGELTGETITKEMFQELVAYEKLERRDQFMQEIYDIHWPEDEDFILTPKDIITILQRYLSGALSEEQVEDWAAGLEFFQGHIKGLEGGTLYGVVEVLANPLLIGILTPERARKLINGLERFELHLGSQKTKKR